MLNISKVTLPGMAGRRVCPLLVRAPSPGQQWLLAVLALGQLSACVCAALLPSIGSCLCKLCPSGTHQLSAPSCVALLLSVSLGRTLITEPSAKFRLFPLPLAARWSVRNQFVLCPGRALYRVWLGRSILTIQSLLPCVASKAKTVLAVLRLARMATPPSIVSCLCKFCTPGTQQLSALPCVALLLSVMPERNSSTEPPAKFRSSSLLEARRCVRDQPTPRLGRALHGMWSSLSILAKWSFPLSVTHQTSAVWLVLCLAQPALRDVQPTNSSVSNIGLIQLCSYLAMLESRDSRPSLVRTWNCYAGVRVGEASHPGPTRSQPTLHQMWGQTPSSPESAPPDCRSGNPKVLDSFRVVVVNPTAVLDKEHALHACRAHVLFLAETSATAGTQVGVGANLAKLGYSTFWSRPVAPHATPGGRPESRRGCAGGAAVVTTLRSS